MRRSSVFQSGSSLGFPGLSFLKDPIHNFRDRQLRGALRKH